MKKHLMIFLLIGWLASCAPSTKDPSNTHLIDEARQRRITELESQLDLQRYNNDHWQMITTGLCLGCVALLILGTSLGAKTRHDAALS